MNNPGIDTPSHTDRSTATASQVKSREGADGGVAASATRARILEAAARIVSDMGAARLRLDLVAGRAGMSKGGLLYHFASKESLLTALMADYVQRVEQRVAEARKAIGDGNDGAGLKASIMGLLGDGGQARSSGAAVLIALANPELMKPIRERIASDTRQLVSSHAHFARAAIVALAMDGLTLREALGLSAFSREQRKALVDQLIRLADEAYRNAAACGE